MTTYRAMGSSEEITDCDLCGKPNLKATVILEYVDSEGEGDGQRFVGRDCAGLLLHGVKNAKNTRLATVAAQVAERRRAEAVKVSAEWLAWTEGQGREGLDLAGNFRRRAFWYRNARHMAQEWSDAQTFAEYRNALAYHATMIETNGALVL